ncbi:MAG: tetratricopeptide repeat protein [Dehalococcoidia bacterium]|nr:tetratricopeptide repeat protein [Dehalococcoidia bacterium]
MLSRFARGVQMNAPTPREEAARLKRQGAEQAIQLALESKWEEAVTLNRSILTTYPNDVDASNRLGKALLEVGRYREAREAYGRSLELDPVNSIAKRNLDRLSTIAEADEPRRTEAVAKVAQDLFIEEIGKTGVTVLRDAPRESLARLTAGDEVYLKPGEELIRVEDVSGEVLGSIEPKLGLRLLRMIEGGNRYAAAVKSVGEKAAELIIKETYRDPSQTRLSFPATGGEGVRPYIKESLLRLADDDDEEELIDEGDTENWEEEPESSESTVSFSAFQNTIERDLEDDDEEE